MVNSLTIKNIGYTTVYTQEKKPKPVDISFDLIFDGPFAVFCAKDKGTTIGHIKVHIESGEYGPESLKKYVFVSYLETPNKLGNKYKGVGTALMQIAMEYGKEFGCKGEIMLNSAWASHRFYLDEIHMAPVDSDNENYINSVLKERHIKRQQNLPFINLRINFFESFLKDLDKKFLKSGQKAYLNEYSKYKLQELRKMIDSILEEKAKEYLKNKKTLCSKQVLFNYIKSLTKEYQKIYDDIEKELKEFIESANSQYIENILDHEKAILTSSVDKVNTISLCRLYLPSTKLPRWEARIKGKKILNFNLIKEIFADSHPKSIGMRFEIAKHYLKTKKITELEALIKTISDDEEKTYRFGDLSNYLIEENNLKEAERIVYLMPIEKERNKMLLKIMDHYLNEKPPQYLEAKKIALSFKDKEHGRAKMQSNALSYLLETHHKKNKFKDTGEVCELLQRINDENAQEEMIDSVLETLIKDKNYRDIEKIGNLLHNKTSKKLFLFKAMEGLLLQKKLGEAVILASSTGEKDIQCFLLKEVASYLIKNRFPNKSIVKDIILKIPDNNIQDSLLKKL